MPIDALRICACLPKIEERERHMYRAAHFPSFPLSQRAWCVFSRSAVCVLCSRYSWLRRHSCTHTHTNVDTLPYSECFALIFSVVWSTVLRLSECTRILSTWFEFVVCRVRAAPTGEKCVTHLNLSLFESYESIATEEERAHNGVFVMIMPVCFIICLSSLRFPAQTSHFTTTTCVCCDFLTHFRLVIWKCAGFCVLRR